MNAPLIDVGEVENMIARAAGRCILPRYEALRDHQVRSKTAPHDLVTQADIDTEHMLSAFFLERYPGCAIVGEEGVAEGKASLETLSEGHDMVWVIDPVDGTYNFVHGRKEFAVMVACVIEGETRYGWIYDVLGGSCGVAVKGRGAFIDGRKLEVSRPESVRSAKGFINARYFPGFAREHIQKYSHVMKEYYTLGCTAHEYLRLAAGSADFAIYSRAKPWDHLAGILMVTEAGGSAAKWDGTPYKPSDRNNGLLIASNQAIWNNLRDVLISPIVAMQMQRLQGAG